MRTINKNTTLEFSNHLMWAQQDAFEAENLNNEDGGTCNFDTVVLKTKGIPAKVLQEVTELTGIKFGKITGSRFWKCCHFIWFETHGQGNLRTRMAEAAYKTLKELGYEVNMYYQMD